MGASSLSFCFSIDVHVPKLTLYLLLNVMKTSLSHQVVTKQLWSRLGHS